MKNYWWYGFILLLVFVASSSCTAPRAKAADEERVVAATALLQDEAWCMERTDSSGNVSYRTVYKPADAAAWAVADGLIHAEHNNYADCMDRSKAGCNVEVFERFSISSNLTYTRDYADVGAADETSALAAEGGNPGGRFLIGDVSWPLAGGGQRMGKVFILYNGVKQQCAFAGPPAITHMVQGMIPPCSTYDIELYPADVAGWGDYMPSGVKRWTAGVCMRGATPQEPGGGGGHDPP
jgi:hypothetical protein